MLSDLGLSMCKDCFRGRRKGSSGGNENSETEAPMIASSGWYRQLWELLLTGECVQRIICSEMTLFSMSFWGNTFTPEEQK